MRRTYRFLQCLCQLGCAAMFGLRVRHRERVPQDGPVLIASNHQSFLDPVLVAVHLWRECSYMARDSLFHGQFARLIRYLNAFPVRRGTADMAAIKEALRRLKRGECLVAFPEGTRTRDGRLQPLIGGVVLIARKARAPIVPTIVLGAFEAWPREAKRPRAQRILVSYGEPITVEQMGRLGDAEIVAELERRLHTLFAEARQDPYVAGRLRALPAAAGAVAAAG